MMRVQVDRIRLDVLLWTLGAFAEVPAAPAYGSRRLADHEIRAIVAAAAEPKSKQQYSLLAERLGRSRRALTVHVARVRRDGPRKSWLPALDRHVSSNGRLAL